MRIVYLQQAESLGGAERQALVALKLLPQFGVEVLPIVGPGKLLCRALDEAGIEYVYSPDLPNGFEGPASPLQRARKVLGYVSSYFKVRDLISGHARAFGADLIYASRPYGWVVGGGAGRVAGIPVVWRTGSRTTSAHQRMWLRIGNARYRPVALIGNCQAVLDSMSPCITCEAHLVPNGVELSRFDPRRAVPSFRDLPGVGDAPVVGMVARPSPDKGFDTVLRALPLLLRRVPQAKLLVAGEYPWRAQYEAAFEKAAPGASRFVGHTEEVRDFYASCDVICLASRQTSTEGSPNALLEAMAMKRPVVATRVAGVGEAVDHGVQGLLVPPGDPDALADSLSTLLESQMLRRRMGEAGRRAIESRFSSRGAISRLVEVLHLAAGLRPVYAEAAE
jgi:glycosyltransferase involved in cell wall biosynthesis